MARDFFQDYLIFGANEELLKPETPASKDPFVTEKIVSKV